MRNGGTSIFDKQLIGKFRLSIPEENLDAENNNMGIMYRQDLLDVLNKHRYVNKDVKLDELEREANATPFLEAINRKISRQPLLNAKTGIKYLSMDDLLTASCSVLEELYNGLTPLMTAVMYGAPLITIQQILEMNPKSLSIKSTIGWVSTSFVTI